MDERKYRSYPKEFKPEALEMLKSSGKSAGQLEQELGITPGLEQSRHAEILDTILANIG
jgi:transposase-like protein